MATANMGITLPVEDGSSGTWDTLLNTALEDVIDVHDHTSGNGVLVPIAGLNINANLDMGGYDINSLLATRYSSQASGALVGETLGLGVISNELYWVTSGGTEVKITDGLGLNSTSIGGITGDYSTTDADVEYDSATTSYEMKQDETPDFFAKVKCADLHLYEEAAGITSYVAVRSPGSLAATYTITLPAATPAGSSLMLMDASGNVTVTTTPPTLTAVTTSGAIEAGTTVTAGTGLTVTSGNATVTSGNVVVSSGDVNVTGDVNPQEVTVSSDYNHTATFQKIIPAACGESESAGAGWTFFNSVADGGAINCWTGPGNADIVSFGLDMRVGDRITNVLGHVKDTSGSGTTITMKLFKADVSANTQALIGVGDTSDASGTYQTLGAPNLTEDVGSADHYTVTFQCNSGTGAYYVYGVTVSYTHPA